MSHRNFGWLVVLCLALVSVQRTVSADDQIWGVDAGAFGDEGSWLFGVVPDADDVAVFNGANSPSATFGSDFTNDRLEISTNTQVSFDLGFNTYELTNPATEVFSNVGSVFIGTSSSQVGNPNVASLSITQGTLQGVMARIGDTFEGAMTLGAESAFALSDELIVGFGDMGTLNVNNGGNVQSVSGSLGNQSDGVGVVNVTGMFASWSMSDNFHIGSSGAGTLNVTAGATVSNVDADAGHITSTIIGLSGDQSSAATVSGAGSTLNAESLTVGASGMGALTVEDGGQVDNTWFANIGNQAAGEGGALVTGADSMWTTGGLTVGWRGPGTLDVEAGGAVESSSYVEIGREAGADGHLTVTGGGSTFTTTSAFAGRGIFVGGDRFGAQGTGTLTVADGGMVDLGAQTLTVWQNGTLDGDGGTITGDVTNHGTVSPGASPGTLTVDGDYTQTADGQLVLEIAGLAPDTEHDQLVVTGNANLDGSLVLRFIGGFAPKTDDVFDLILADGSVNVTTGLAVAVEGLLDGFDFDLSSIAGGYRLTALNDAEAVPEPAAWLALGLAGMLWRRRGGRRHHQ